MSPPNAKPAGGANADGLMIDLSAGTDFVNRLPPLQRQRCRLTPEYLDRVRSRASIDERLQAWGCRRARHGNWHCYGHEDRTASASTKKGPYHCFSCGRHLDVIGLTMDFHALDFRSAVQLLADDLGISLETSRRAVTLEQRSAARAEAKMFVLWRSELLEHLAEYECLNFRLYHTLKVQILTGDVRDEELARTMDECELAESRYLSAEQSRRVIERTDDRTLLRIWRRRSEWLR